MARRGAASLTSGAGIWAFCGVVYEMVTGKSLFAGETVTDAPNLDAAPADAPPQLRALPRGASSGASSGCEDVAGRHR